jgi:oleate hydratase
LPLQAWLESRGVNLITDCTATDLEHAIQDGKLSVTSIHCLRQGKPEVITVNEGDMVFIQNGSMTEASSLGSMSSAPAQRTKDSGAGWTLWEKLARTGAEFGNPAAFNSCIAQSCWESFTVTLTNPEFFDKMTRFSGNQPGTGGLVTFKDSNWLLSIVLAHQPHFRNQPAGVQVFWGYSLFPDRVGNFVAKPMAECNGAEILEELCGLLRFDLTTVAGANCIPCRMPYITSMFMPRSPGDRPLPVPRGAKNLAFVSQFVEIPDDVVFSVEYSVRAAQTAVYELFGVDRKIPVVTPHDRSLRVRLDALLKAFK